MARLTSKIDVKCTPEFHKLVEDLAWQNRLSVSELVRNLLQTELDRASMKRGKHAPKLPQKGE